MTPQVWRKSSRSSSNASASCVEVGIAAHHVAVRDTKAPSMGTLVITAHDWRTMLIELKGQC